MRFAMLSDETPVVETCLFKIVFFGAPMLYSSSNEQVVDRHECEHMLSSLGRNHEFILFMDVHLPQLIQRLGALKNRVELVHHVFKADLDFYLNFTAHTPQATHQWSVLLNSLDAVFILNAFGKCYSASNAAQLVELIWNSLSNEINPIESASTPTAWAPNSAARHGFSPV
jgi:hypothetical protein